MSGPSFVAIDFETSHSLPDSACSVGLVRVVDGEVVERRVELIRPPRRPFMFTDVHGLTWRDVADAPPFGEVWPTLEPMLGGATFLAAHNAGFDRRVLRACCEAAGLPMPPLPFQCTVVLARRTWRLPRNNLAAVCAHLQIPLQHHEAGSDAEACARIVLAAHALSTAQAVDAS